MSVSAPRRSILLAVSAGIGIVVLGWLVGGLGAVIFIRTGPDVVFHEDFSFWNDVVVYTITTLFTAGAALAAGRLMRYARWSRVASIAVAVVLTTVTNALLNVPFLANSGEPTATLVVVGSTFAGSLIGAFFGTRDRNTDVPG